MESMLFTKYTQISFQLTPISLSSETKVINGCGRFLQIVFPHIVIDRMWIESMSSASFTPPTTCVNAFRNRVAICW